MNTYKIEQTQIIFREQKYGPVLGYSRACDVPIIKEGDYYFKNLSRSGHLEKYEDWRLCARERAEDLVKRLSIEEIAGLMAYSCMIHIPNDHQEALHSRRHTFGGKSFKESGMDAAAVSDQVISAIRNEHIRHFFVGGCQSGAAMIEWNNRIQEIAEQQPFGIPCIKATDPRHSQNNISRAVFGTGNDVSVWTEGIGLAACFNEKTAFDYGRTVAREYRALGIQCILGPQIDLATEPRWARYPDTFGPNVDLVTKYARAVIDGYQTSSGKDEIENGWGYESIYAIAKHWPGGGSGEGGRDAHYALGKYSIYPGNNFKQHLKPFTEGALKLSGPTKKAAGIMPYYTISSNMDECYKENVGNGFSRYIVKDLLREKYQYDGIVCSDWEITADAPQQADEFGGKCWGTEHLSVPERMAKALRAGVDQFGGVDFTEDIVKAYTLIKQSCGEAPALSLFRESALKLLENMFRLGMFENPYLDMEKSERIIGSNELRCKGKSEQAQSAVLLKNKDNVLPLQRSDVLYIPQCGQPIAKGLSKAGFRITGIPQEADCGIVFLNEPLPQGMSGSPFERLRAGFDAEDLALGGNGYVPISLQYKPYKAVEGRAVSLMGDAVDNKRENRSYKDKVAKNDRKELNLLLDAKETLGETPLIVILSTGRPVVVGEFEKYAHGILLDFGLEADVLINLLTGKQLPGGRLPFTIPLDMDCVERHCEDMDDLTPYVDELGNSYGFGYGKAYEHEKTEHKKLL